MNRSSSVSFDSLAPAHLALRANLRLLFLKDPPAFSVVRSVVSSAGFGLHALENPALVLGLVSHRPSGSNSLHNQKMFLFAPACVVG